MDLRYDGKNLRVVQARKLVNSQAPKSGVSSTDPDHGIPLVNGVYQVVYRPVPNRSIPSDLALILCHYGQDALRVQATKAALAILLRDAPQTFFVECVDVDAPCHFKDLPNTIHFERTLTEASKGLWLKEALWSIGAREAMARGFTKLLFVDADCSYTTGDWAQQISDALENCDVISPYHWSYYAEQVDTRDRPRDRMRSSRGFRYATGAKGGHAGLALAMTSAFFRDRLDQQLPLSSCGGGDVLFWVTLLGRESGFNGCVQYNSTHATRRGMLPRPKVGYADLTLCHHYHGPIEKRGYIPRQVLSLAGSEMPGSEFVYGVDGIPIWNRDLPGGRILARAYPKFLSKLQAEGKQCTADKVRDIYDEEALVEYGPIDMDNPLTIACLLRTGGMYRKDHVYALKEQFEEHCKAPFRFVCLSDIDIPGVETSPLTFDVKDCHGWWGQVEYFREGVFAPNETVIACDLDNVVLHDFTPHQCPRGEFFTEREIGKWDKSVWAIWNFGVSCWRGDFHRVYDDYKMYVHHPYLNPHYQHISVQEFVYDTLRSQGVYPRAVEAHLMTRFYNPDDVDRFEGTHIMAFPDKPKPWNINPRPAWLPPSYAKYKLD